MLASHSGMPSALKPEPMLLGPDAHTQDVSDTKDVIMYRRAPALPDDNVVALCDAEAWGHVGCDVAVPLLIPADISTAISGADSQTAGCALMPGSLA